MRTRMDKYHNNEELLERTSKNDSLYEQLYRESNWKKSTWEQANGLFFKTTRIKLKNSTEYL